jgi:hypothetical protein
MLTLRVVAVPLKEPAVLRPVTRLAEVHKRWLRYAQHLYPSPSWSTGHPHSVPTPFLEKMPPNRTATRQGCDEEPFESVTDLKKHYATQMRSDSDQNL